jgi:hypothetical protein
MHFFHECHCIVAASLSWSVVTRLMHETRLVAMRFATLHPKRRPVAFFDRLIVGNPIDAYGVCH